MSANFESLGFKVEKPEMLEDEFTPLGFRAEEPEEKVSDKARKVAKGFGFFGLQPKPETIEAIRQPTGVALKEFAESHGFEKVYIKSSHSIKFTAKRIEKKACNTV